MPENRWEVVRKFARKKLRFFILSWKTRNLQAHFRLGPNKQTYPASARCGKRQIRSHEGLDLQGKELL